MGNPRIVENRKRKVKYGVFEVKRGKPKHKEVPPVGEGPLRWDMPIEVLDRRLEGFREEIHELGGFIRTRTVRNAMEDVKKYGY